MATPSHLHEVWNATAVRWERARCVCLHHRLLARCPRVAGRVLGARRKVGRAGAPDVGAAQVPVKPRAREEASDHADGAHGQQLQAGQAAREAGLDAMQQLG